MAWKTWLSIAVLSVVVVCLAGFRLLFRHGKPLGESPQIQFPTTMMSAEEVGQFLSGNFVPINRVGSLPEEVRVLYTEVGGTRSTMANPGEKFEKNDFITDASLPRKRLIFAGCDGEKCFVHYEHGGIGLHSDLALFRITSPRQAKPIWEGACGDVGVEATRDLAALRSLVARGECHDKSHRGQ